MLFYFEVNLLDSAQENAARCRSELADDGRSRGLPAVEGAQALRAGRGAADPLHQGDGQVAVLARRSRPLAARRHGAPARRCAAEPPPIVGGSHDPLLQWALEREPRRARDPARGQRGRLPALPQGRGDRRRHPFPRPGRSRRRTPIPSGRGRAGAARCGADRLRGPRAGSGRRGRKSAASWPRCARPMPGKLRAAVRPEGAGAQQLLLGLLAATGLSIDDLDIAHRGADGTGYRPGHPRRPCRLRRRHARGGHRGGARLRAALHRALRPADAPARLLPPAAAGAVWPCCAIRALPPGRRSSAAST